VKGSSGADFGSPHPYRLNGRAELSWRKAAVLKRHQRRAMISRQRGPMGKLIPADDGDLNPPPCGEVSNLLRAWSNGDRSALEKLTPIVYDELHRLARHYMRSERSGHSLQTTALVNEAYVRLTDYKRMRWENRAHFFAVSAQLMRRILVDHARRHNLKRGAAIRHISLEDAAAVRERDQNLVVLDEALQALARFDSRKAQVVELRFFGGLSVEETAEVLKVSPVTVMRDWSTARAWLYREMKGESPNGSRTLETDR